MKTKKVELIVAPGPTHFVGNGFRVHNFIPSKEKLTMERMNPFILLDYNSAFVFGPSDIPRGVGVHPHKGFETVTIAYKGKVEHHDSSGGGGVIDEGDVQWMTAGAGVLHKEFHETEWSKKGGEFQMVQLWVNLPAKFKNTPAKYQAIKNGAISRVELNNNSYVQVIAGSYNNVKGNAFTFTTINMLNTVLTHNEFAKFSFPANYNTAILVISGNILINHTEKVATNYFALMENEGEYFTIKAIDNATFLLLSAEPINEPIAAYGPFVMNTEQELVEAFNDFNNGKFGFLAD